MPTSTIVIEGDRNLHSEDNEEVTDMNVDCHDPDFQSHTGNGTAGKHSADSQLSSCVTLNLPRNPFKSRKISTMADRLNLSAG